MTSPPQLVGLLAGKELPALGRYRAEQGWTVNAADEKHFWLRIPFTEKNRKAFEKLPLLHRWELREDLLYRRNHQLPEQSLPEGEWKPLCDALPFPRPATGLPACPPAPIIVQLVPSPLEQEPIALLTEGERAGKWSESAFLPRLKKLQFSVCETTEVLFLGFPLPPLEGTALYQIGRLLLPCGWALPDFIHPLDYEEAFSLRADELLLLRPDHTADRLLKEQLLPATRAYLRASLSTANA
ncbi:hypothetical protein AAFN60_11695 [Roseibacillus persicicus]|uniref:hypothetical protein n=1 Tax=Roseibacillus persicicus TaxID=454148 RepID=UPI00398B1038